MKGRVGEGRDTTRTTTASERVRTVGQELSDRGSGRRPRNPTYRLAPRRPFGSVTPTRRRGPGFGGTVLPLGRFITRDAATCVTGRP